MSETMTPTDVAVLALAVFRLTRLVTTDTLPPVQGLRDRFIAWVGKDSSLVVEEDGEYTLCPWCLAVWVAVAVVPAALRFQKVRKALLIPAASAMAGLLSTADSALGRMGN